ncbi:MAG: hypothetical protein Devi2KO_10960 [Devosia indica]
MLAGPGTVVMVPSHARHNYSNAGSVPAAMTVVLEQQMIDFFEELGTTQPPEAGPPSAEMMERVMQSCARHGIVILDQAERAA